MADFFIELFGRLLDGLLPQRSSDVAVGLTMFFLAAVFAGLGALFAYKVLLGVEKPAVALVVVLFVLLSAFMFRVGQRSFRQLSARPKNHK